jgi:nucleotide-binding universal stress UspA family protein
MAASVGSLETIVRVGSVAEQIIRVSHELTVDLVVIGAPRDHPLPWTARARTLERLVAEAPCSVLVARPSHAPRRILLAGNHASDVRAAVQVLAGLPLPRGTAILMLAALPSLKEAMLAAHGTDTWSRLRNRQGRVPGRVAAIAQETKAVGTRAGWSLGVAVVAGHLPARIVEAAAQRRADLIVLGASAAPEADPTRSSRLAQAVVRHAPCSVLVARPRRCGLDRHADSLPDAPGPTGRVTAA